MADVGCVWRTEYAAEGATMSKKQFEELAEIANRLTRVVSMNMSEPAIEHGSSMAQLYSWAITGFTGAEEKKGSR